MSGIENVENVQKWLYQDLKSSKFSSEEAERVLDDLDELEEHLTVWNRDLMKCVGIVEEIDDPTVYKRRVGDLRSYHVREGNTLYCIGAGKRKKTYDRDLDTIQERGKEHLGN